MLETQDGHGRLELVKFHSPSVRGGDEQAPANTLGIRHVTFAVDDIDGAVATGEPAAVSSLARWRTTKTSIGFATSVARRGSSSSWRSGSAEDGGAAGQRRDPHPGPASARLRELHAGRARRRACRGSPCHLGPAAHAGAVRARCPTAPTSRAVPGLPRAVRHLHRPVLAAVRLGRAGHGHLGTRGRVPTLPLDPPAAVRQDTGARPRTWADGHDRRAPGGGDRLVPHVSVRRGSSGDWCGTTSPCS